MMVFLIIIFALWRITLFVIAGYGSTILNFTPSFPYSAELLINSGLPDWIWGFANFDGVHYITIARSGYLAQYTQVFFPLYPLIIKLSSIVLPFLHTIQLGLLISNISFLVSLFVFVQLLRIDYKPNEIKLISLFLLFFPTSFFFGSLYTEGLFFLFIISSFYFARIKRWWLAGFFGALASATRLVGLFLLPALLWEWHQQNKLKSQNLKLKTITLHFTLSALHSPILYLVPLGLIAYMIYLQGAYGDWLYFWHAQPVFGAQRSGGSIILLPQVYFRYLKIFLTVPTNNYKFWISLTELLSATLAIVLLVFGHLKKIRLSYLIFSWLAIIVPTFSGTFSSMPRYIIVAFPLFITLALIHSRLIKFMILFMSAAFLILFTVLFTRGLWVG